MGFKDHYHGSRPVMSDEAKAWVISLVCAKPEDLGLAGKLWKYRELGSTRGRRGSDSAKRMQEVLMVYGEVNYHNEPSSQMGETTNTSDLTVIRRTSLPILPPRPCCPRSLLVIRCARPPHRFFSTGMRRGQIFLCRVMRSRLLRIISRLSP